MARPMDYRCTLPHPADEVYTTMVDPEYLQARLVRLGGPGAALHQHNTDAQGARYQLIHGLDEAQLPPSVRSFLPGDIVVQRAERWQRADDGRYEGEVIVRIPGTPASAAGWMRLTDQDSAGSEFRVHADVTVKIPLFGGKVEELVAEQIAGLLALESQFTLDYMR